jgi:hypothetical protein
VNRTVAGSAVVLCLTLPTLARAAAPTIKGTTPVGVQRGASTEVTVDGTHLKGTPELIAPFAFTSTVAEAPNADAGHWKTTINVAPGTAVGVYPIRVRTEEGLSNPLLFAVGQLPQMAETEDNGAFESAQAIPSPVVVEGQVAGNDVDYFRFPGKKGDRIVVDAQCARVGSGVDPAIRLTTAARAYVASADDTPGLLTDARLITTLPDDTDYVVELSDSRYQGGGRPIYRLVVGPVPTAEEVYPMAGRRGETVGLEVRGGTLTTLGVAAATLDPSPMFEPSPYRVIDPTGTSSPSRLDVESLTPLMLDDMAELREPADPGAPPLRAAAPIAFNGRIDPAGDEDRFVLQVTPGQTLRIEVDASDHGSALDGTLQVVNAKGVVLASADDTAAPAPAKGNKAAPIASPDPSLDFTVPSGLGQVTVAFRDLESRGGTGFAYRIRVVPSAASFELALDEAEVSIPRGGTAAVGMSVIRKGYSGPIALTVLDPPTGLTVRPGKLAEGQLVGSLTLSAASDAAIGAVMLKVVGRAQGSDGPIVATARTKIVFASQGPLATSKIVQNGLAAALASPTPVTLKTSDSPVEIAQGFGGTVPIELKRDPGAESGLTVGSLPLPPGLSLAETKIAEEAEQGSVTVNATTEVPLGSFTIALMAKGKFDGTDHVISAPEVTLNVVRPAEIELSSPGIEVSAGQPAEVKGKVIRRGTFKEEVTVKLDKLPAGLKTEPIKVTADQSEFTIKIESEPAAPAAEAKAELALVLQVAKKDYPVPPVSLPIKVLAAK